MHKGSLTTIVVFIALAAFAIVGWVRPPSTVAAAPSVTPLTPATFSAALNPAADVANTPEPVSTQPQARRVYAHRKRHRPFSHSVAIVAGSAGAGAAIGGLAGGAKGAGIGALSGGAAGLIYDRLTHNR